MLVASVRFSVLLDCGSLIYVDFISLFVILIRGTHVKVCFSFDGIKKFLT